ncbi:substrate-binding domain-containing protein [Janibacter sp. GS2]|uniref:substrate-binding domain-containing protein n=1 Tax=Janibacter sp. GS2 TaxID=3442646 RepID=UPI003EC04FF1
MLPAGGDALRVGLAVPLQGPGGIFGPSCEAVAALWLRQTNVHGLLGRPVELVLIDAGRPAAQVAQSVLDLVESGGIDALTGWHISSVREAVAPVTQGRIPYVYTSLYEGGESRPGVFCAGETPDEQIAPALAWARDELGLRRWHIVGSDYVWPQRSALAAAGYANTLGLEVLSTTLTRFGADDFTAVLEAIERGPRADGVLTFLVGEDAVRFNREFAARGLDERLVRLTPLMEENMLLAAGVEATRGVYVSASYFRSLATGYSLDFVGDYTTAFGPEAPALNNQGESCYEGLQLLSSLFDAAGSVSIDAVLRVSEGLGYDGPRGPMELRAGHLRQSVYLARADVTDFDVLTAL